MKPTFKYIQRFENADIYVGDQYNYATKSARYTEGEIIDYCIEHGANVYSRIGNGIWYIKKIDKPYRVLQEKFEYSEQGGKYKGTCSRLIVYK